MKLQCTIAITVYPLKWLKNGITKHWQEFRATRTLIHCWLGKANSIATVEESLAKHCYIIKSSNHTPNINKLR